MTNTPELLRFETEGNMIKRLQVNDQYGLYEAQKIARRAVLLKSIADAEDIGDIKSILERIVTGD